MNAWHGSRGTAASTSVPLVHVAAGVGAGEVKWGLDTYSNVAGGTAVLQQAAAGRITAIADPQVSVATVAACRRRCGPACQRPSSGGDT